MTSAPGTSGTSALYLPRPARIVALSDLSPREKLFRLELPGGADLGHQPGQFVQVSLLGIGEAPISVCSSPTRSGYFELGVRAVGSLTQSLHRLAPGTDIGIRGPFGRPFAVEELAGQDLLLISGGCGMAPLRSLVQYCEDRPQQFGRITLLYGAKSPADQLFKEDLAAWQASERFACAYTVDEMGGESCYGGSVGLITALIPPLEIDPDRTRAAVVGPPAMYRPVIAELRKKGLGAERIIVSLERQMRCGVGKCGHCTIEHLYCCTDGPVFRLSEVGGLRGAL